MAKRSTSSVCAVLAVLCGWLSCYGQLRGSPELTQALERLPITGSLLHTAAHPDDEQSTLLAYLARGRHVRTAYLSATRGDGGQNLLGSERSEALGLLRTQELADARRLDGADQFFTRAFDFGFSKTPEESLAKWGHEETLGDFVRIIRQYRPDVMVSVWSGTAADGHGQHQATGILAPEAFKAAADPARFPEQHLPAWQVKKFYQTINRFGALANSPMPANALTLDVGEYDPVLGASYSQIGSEGRVWHRSQGFGAFGPVIGPARMALVLRDSSLPANAAEKDLFDGIDITLDRYTQLGAPAAEVAALKQTVTQILAAYQPEHPEKLVPMLAAGLERVRGMRAKASEGLAFYLDLKESEFKRALGLSQTMIVDAVCERAELLPGQKSKVTVSVWNRAKSPMKVAAIALSVPAGWTVDSDEFAAAEIGNEQKATRVFSVMPPANAPVSQPYWLVKPRVDDRFTVDDASLIGRLESPPLVTANVSWSTGGDTVISQSTPVVNRLVDTIYGARDVRLNVVPAIAAWTDPQVQVFTPGATHEIKVRLRNNSTNAANGKFSLNVPAGWSVTPREQNFEIAKHGDESAYTFQVKSLANAQEGVAAATPYSTGYQVIDYPHIVPQYWFHPAETKLVPLDVKMDTRQKIGYIMGPGDDVPAALRQLGVSITMLDTDELLSGDLSKYNVIVAGIRVYEVRPDVVSANHRLLDYVKNGGVFIVQYQGSFLMFNQPFRYGPYPMAYGQPLSRVTVEDAPIDILERDSAVFHTPNEITPADFRGWVQERGLMFVSTWDDHYTPLMASNDPGEPPQKGGMLLAHYGKGLYLYTAYAWFRQLPAGVPGAYRIWANILSLKP